MGRRAQERDSSSQNAKRFVERCELGLAKSSVPVKIGARSRPARSRQETVLGGSFLGSRGKARHYVKSDLGDGHLKVAAAT